MASLYARVRASCNLRNLRNLAASRLPAACYYALQTSNAAASSAESQEAPGRTGGEMGERELPEVPGLGALDLAQRRVALDDWLGAARDALARGDNRAAYSGYPRLDLRETTPPFATPPT